VLALASLSFLQIVEMLNGEGAVVIENLRCVLLWEEQASGSSLQ
jgi:hypothetical protein